MCLLGGDDKNRQMEHDYLDYCIQDMLQNKKIPFLTQKEIQDDELLFNYFNRSSPDIVVRGLHIFDVAVGYAASEKKNNYKNIEKKFTFDVLTPHSFQSVLLERKVFTQQECTQLLQNYSVSRRSTSTGWRASSCRKFCATISPTSLILAGTAPSCFPR